MRPSSGEHARRIADPRRVLKVLLVALVLGSAYNAALRAAAPELSPDLLDNAEDKVCGAATLLAEAKAASARKESVPVERVIGQEIADPRRRQYLQQQLDARLESAQSDQIRSFAGELASSQNEHRRLTGHEFDTARCGDRQRRIQRRETWEKRRQERALQANAEKIASSEETMLRAACRERQIIDGPPKEVAHTYRPEELKVWKEHAQAAWDRLLAAYERAQGKRFDPRRCR